MNQEGNALMIANTHHKRATRSDLVYLEESPDYCLQDPALGQYRCFIVEYSQYRRFIVDGSEYRCFFVDGSNYRYFIADGIDVSLWMVVSIDASLWIVQMFHCGS